MEYFDFELIFYDGEFSEGNWNPKKKYTFSGHPGEEVTIDYYGEMEGELWGLAWASCIAYIKGPEVSVSTFQIISSE